MTRGVVYMIAGNKHAVVLAVSLHSLRKHWNGPVTLFVEESADYYATPLAKSASAEAVRFDMHKQRRHSGYANKPRIPAVAVDRYDNVIQLDADTMVVGSLDELWPQCSQETVLTWYANWITTGRKIGKRLEAWRRMLPNLVTKQKATAFPAVNTGVMAYGCASELALESWLATVLLNPTVFISDEIAMQLIYPEHPHVRMLKDEYNFSPIYSKERPRDQIHVIHYHGRKHVKERALPFWWPEFEETWRENYGGIQEWAPGRDNRLAEYAKQVGWEWGKKKEVVA